jgi:hypothetical protein
MGRPDRTRSNVHTPTDRRRRWGAIATGLASAAAGLATVGAAPAAAQEPPPAPTPFTCDSPTIVLATHETAGGPTQLRRRAVATPGPFTNIGGVAPFHYDAIAYNPADDLVYGILKGDLIRIDATGTPTALGTIGILDDNGAFAPDGTFYAAEEGARMLHAVDIDTLTVTSTALRAVVPTGDFVWIDGMLWGQAGKKAALTRIDPSTGAVQEFAFPAIPTSTDANAAWTYTDGDLGISDDRSGVIHRIEITAPSSSTPTFTLVSTQEGPPRTDSDGTACGRELPPPAKVTGLCRGTALALLGLRLGSANNPEAPCATATNALVTVNQTIGNAFPWPLTALTSTLKATAVAGSTTAGPNSAAAESHIAAVSINLPTLGLSIAATGIRTTASASVTPTAGACLPTVAGTSHIANLVVNGAPITVGDQPFSVALPGLGGLHVNQQVVTGGTVVERALFLDLPGTALDIVIAESKAGVACT